MGRGQADAAPGMDGGAVDMRGSDARGCGDGHGCAVGTRLFNMMPEDDEEAEALSLAVSALRERLLAEQHNEQK